MALRSGSSQHGKARRASVASNWVTAIHGLPRRRLEPAPVEPAQEVVQLSRETQLQTARCLSASGSAERRHSCSPLGPVRDALASCSRPVSVTSLASLTSSSAALSTISLVAVRHSQVDRRRTGEGGVVQVGLEDQGVVIGHDVRGVGGTVVVVSPGPPYGPRHTSATRRIRPSVSGAAGGNRGPSLRAARASRRARSQARSGSLRRPRSPGWSRPRRGLTASLALRRWGMAPGKRLASEPSTSTGAGAGSL